MSKGLHHHGEAPEAAGYTIRELARLARSAVPGQRCIAYQTLGRILYRLGNGDFGGVSRDDVSMGIWREVEEGAVLRSLHDEAGAEEGRGRGHRSARVFATEAIWLFEKGGWKGKLKKAYNTGYDRPPQIGNIEHDEELTTIWDQAGPARPSQLNQTRQPC
ncbi:hypothetical protein NUW58_g10266 [Xylaria curta]|uniref:Uncharacterized protein n=1 Tax=Xylaria curta TaxID=42375 RepID=A0ACC1MN11_9PEZI|nr:hypothetical protein NUW58_g10266 [Xylaria curta]